MARFLIRVELHTSRSRDDYNLLHDEMEAEGFSRTITSGDGVTYHLPPAEYSYEGDVDKSAVLGKAKRAAKATGHEYGVIVCEGSRTWDGLKKVK